MLDKTRSEKPINSKRAILVRNPNVGKSLILGSLTNGHPAVSNYPRPTEEITPGQWRIGSEEICLIDAVGG